MTPLILLYALLIGDYALMPLLEETCVQTVVYSSLYPTLQLSHRNLQILCHVFISIYSKLISLFLSLKKKRKQAYRTDRFQEIELNSMFYS